MIKSRGNKPQNPSKRSGDKNIVIKVLRWTYHSIMAVTTLGLLSLYLASAFSDRVDPNTFLYLSYFGIGYHIILILLASWLVVLLILRHWKLSAIVFVCFLLTWSQITRYYPINFGGNNPVKSITSSDGKTKIIEPEIVKVFTYNTCALGQTHLSRIKENIPIIKVIRESGADIVCLQEYAFTLSKGGHTQEQLRKSLSDLYPYYDFMPNYRRTAMGIALFSKYPIKNMARIDKRKKDYVSSMYYELDINGRKVILNNNHLHTNSIKPKDRELYDEMIDHFEADSLSRIKTGLIRNLGRSYKARSSQSELITSFISEKKGSQDIPMIVCGDFNDTPISYCYRKMRGDLLDAWQEAGFGSGTTYNRHHFWFRIDHIFHSKHFRTLDIKILKEYNYSDHYPVVATLQLLPPEE